MTAAYRHELKYLITDAVCHELSRVLAGVMPHDSHAGPQAFTESEACTLTIFTAPPTVKNWTEWKSAKNTGFGSTTDTRSRVPGMQAQKRRVYL